MKNALIMIRWLVVNSAFAAALYFALQGHDGITNVYVSLVWLMAVALVATRAMDHQTAHDKMAKHPVPAWLDRLHDFTVVFVLVYFGWWWTALGMFIHLVALDMIRDTPKVKPSNETIDGLRRRLFMDTELAVDAFALLQSQYAIAQREGAETEWEDVLAETRKVLHRAGKDLGPAANEFQAKP